MEAVRTRHSIRRDRSYIETTFEAAPSTDSVTLSVDGAASNVGGTGEIDEGQLCELKGFQQKLLHQEALLTTKQQKMTQKRTKAKADVKQLFDVLHELLERKEVEMNTKVDSTYDDIESGIDTSMDNFHRIRDPVDTMLDKCKFGFRDTTKEMLRECCTDTLIKLRATEPVSEEIPEFSINFYAEKTIQDLKYGHFDNEPEERTDENRDQAITNTGSDSRDSNTMEHVASENGSSVAMSEQIPSDNVDSVFDSQQDVNDNSEDSWNHRELIDGTGNFSRRVESLTSEQPGIGAHSLDNAAAATSSEPSAPPLEIVVDEAESNPPPYWQAIGLSGPTEGTSPSVVPPLHTASYSDPCPVYSEFDTYPTASNSCNTMELWHSFPLRRQYDKRKPLYVAMTWDDRRICVADRNNKMVKFFSHSGTPLTEIYISSGEIYDVAYLESHNGEARYIATLPKEKTLLLLSVMEDNRTRLVKKLVLKKSGNSFYTSICRGPNPQTLVGAVTTPGSAGAYYPVEKPHVEMFDFDGNVLQVYQRTINYEEFQYPRSVQVFGSTIFVADWKLSIVAAFLADGTPVSQYKGTTASPLVNPLDLAIDCYGNVLIVDGEFSNIHVISADGHPIEVMKVPAIDTNRSQPKLVAFDPPTRRLATVRSNGDLAVFTFRDNYQAIPPGEMVLHPDTQVSVPANESLPFVEGMLPSTIASIGRQRTRNRDFYL